MKDRKLLLLVEEAKQGDQDAFTQLMRMKNKDIFYIASSLMKNKQDGEDAAQEAIIRIRENIAGLQNAEYFNTWMYRIVYGVCMNMMKRTKLIDFDTPIEFDTAPFYEEREEFLPQDFVLNKEKRTQLLRMVDRLPDNHRNCLLLFYYEELSYNEIAATLGMTPQDVASYIFRAKKKLRNMLELDEKPAVTKPTPAAALGALPVLSEVLHADATDSYTREIEEHLNAVASGKPPVSMPIREAGAVAAVAAVAAGSAFPSFAAKAGAVVAGVALVGVVVGGTAALLNTLQEGTAPQFPLASTGTTNPATEDLPAIPESLLSPEAAQGLKELVALGTDDAHWDAFAAAQDMSLGSYVVTTEYIYRVYYIENQGERLTVIERRDNEGTVALTYSSGKATGETPQDKGIINAFDSWDTSRT